MVFTGGSVSKESAHNTGDFLNTGGPGSILELGRSLEKETATYSSILTWEIPWTEEPGGSMGHSPWGHKESDMNEHTHTHKPLVAALSRTRLVPPWPGL